MKIYVAGRTSNVAVVRETQEICRQKGHEITFDWTDPVEGELRPDLDTSDIEVEDVRKGQDPNPFSGGWETTLTHKPSGHMVVVYETTQLRAHEKGMKELRKKLGGWEENPEKAQKIALREQRGVLEADCLIALFSDGKGLGKIIETGMALGMGKPVILVGPFAESVFWYMPSVERVPDLEALRAIL